MLRSTKLFVGRLNTGYSVEVLKKTLFQIFSDFGEVRDVFVLTDKITRKPRGSAFVTMSTDQEARQAQRGLDGVELTMDDEDQDPRVIVVNFARPLERKDGPGSNIADG
jgi:RNA recognition motif-containing protein